jgi:FKBP-type peptidyl-prolyl cis-trans isomerase SlyD
MTVTMENEAGEPKDFIVTRVDENSVTVDGNNPMCGREVIHGLSFANDHQHVS